MRVVIQDNYDKMSKWAASYIAAKINAHKEVEIQYRQLCFNLSNAYETYMNEKENIEVTQRVFHSTTEKFKWGAASNLELTNASNDLISAQSTYVQAMLSLINAEAELEEFLNK